MMRAVVSAPPPGGNPTIRRTGRDGYACALADPDTIGSAAAPAVRCRNCLRWGSFIKLSLKFIASGAITGTTFPAQRRGVHDRLWRPADPPVIPAELCLMRGKWIYSPLILAALMIGHHFSISAF